MDRDPIIDNWLRTTLSANPTLRVPTELVLEIDQLSALRLVASEPGVDVPDEVLARWYPALTRARRLADQSEPAFIEQARHQGWSWARIAAVLGLPDAEAAERRPDALAAELTRTHPSVTPQPWVPRQL
jgi:hypothetical protein